MTAGGPAERSRARCSTIWRKLRLIAPTSTRATVGRIIEMHECTNARMQKCRHQMQICSYAQMRKCIRAFVHSCIRALCGMSYRKVLEPCELADEREFDDAGRPIALLA